MFPESRAVSCVSVSSKRTQFPMALEVMSYPSLFSPTLMGRNNRNHPHPYSAPLLFGDAAAVAANLVQLQIVFSFEDQKLRQFAWGSGIECFSFRKKKNVSRWSQ